MSADETVDERDTRDPLAYCREWFELPDDVVYLDGNSLGPLPRGVAERVAETVRQQWGQNLITAWNRDGWWELPLRVGDRIGRLVGAAPGQMCVGESTSVQIFNALCAAARLRPGRDVVLADADHFPTDSYLADSVARLLGLRVVRAPMADLPAALERHAADVAVVFCGAVDYRTGELFDVPGLTEATHRAGALALWDLSHAAGAVPLRLDDDGVDLAVGCGYKYLSGGPGAPAFLYVARRHLSALDLPLTGWHAHADPFAMAAGFRPADGPSRLRIGTPHILSLVALDAALDTVSRVEVATVREKSLRLGDALIAAADRLPAEFGVEVASPREAARRGSHVSLVCPDARAVMAALIDRGILGDVRAERLLRLCTHGLYLSFADIERAVRVLGEVLVTGAHRDPRFAVREAVS